MTLYSKKPDGETILNEEQCLNHKTLHHHPQTLTEHWLFSPTCGPVAFLFSTLPRLQIKPGAIPDNDKPTEDVNTDDTDKEVGRVGTVKGSFTGRWVGLEAVQAHLWCCMAVNCGDKILIIQIHLMYERTSIDHWSLTINHGGFKQG